MVAGLATSFGEVQAEAGLAALPEHAARQRRRNQVAEAYRAGLAGSGVEFGGLVDGAEPSDWVTVAFHPHALDLRRRA